MKYYKIVLSKGEPIIVDEIKVEKILSCDENLVKIWNEDHTKFNVINKAHIVQIRFDHENKIEKYEFVNNVYKLKKE